VPGTRNYPNRKKRDLGRGETESRLMRWTWRRYSWTELEQLAEHLRCNPPRHAVPCEPPRQRPSLGEIALPDDTPDPLDDDLVAELRRTFPEAFDLANFDGDQSRQDLALAGLAYRSGLSPLEAWGLIIAVRDDKKAHRRDYIERTLARAYAKPDDDAPTLDDLERESADEAAAAGQTGGNGAAGAQQPQWPEPEPLVSEHERAAPYPIDALPPTIRPAVLCYQAYGQQPVEIVAAAALAAASLVCQPLADVDRDGNLAAPCSLSFAIVAVSGERKSAADKRMRRAIARWERERRLEQVPEIKAATRQHAIWKAQLEGMTRAITNLSGKTGEDNEVKLQQLKSKLLAHEDDEPKIPAEVALFHEETTPEKLALILATGWPSSSLWSDEAGLVIGSHAMTKDVAMRFLALLNRLWDGGEMKRERVARESAHLRGRRFTVSLMMQPHVLATLMKVGDGVSPVAS
jgi:hypothetical protein